MNQCIAGECSRVVIAGGLCQPHYDRKRRYGDLVLRPDELKCLTCDNMFPSGASGNHARFCMPCRIERHRLRNKTGKFIRRIRSQYGITAIQYFMMHDAQGGVCLICSQKTKGQGEVNNRLAVDHNHLTGEVRGLLCAHCNTGLGLFRDNPDLLIKASLYLKEKN